VEQYFTDHFNLILLTELNIFSLRQHSFIGVWNVSMLLPEKLAVIALDMFLAHTVYKYTADMVN